MRKLIFASAALATLCGSTLTPAEAYLYHSRYHEYRFGGGFCRDHVCGHGPVRRHVCERWEIFGGDRHCVSWRWIW